MPSLHAMAVSLSFIHILLLPKPLTSHLCEGRWPRVGEDLLASRLGSAVRQRELEVLGEELLDVGAADVLGVVDLDDLEDADGAETGTVTSSHVLVEGLNGVGTAHLTELLVHVVGTGARVVAEPDTEVLDLGGALLGNHIEADDLTVGLLDLAELGQEVPEPGLGHDGVGRKDAHAVELGRGVCLGGQVTPDDLVLRETPYNHSSQSLFVRCLGDFPV
jgi:hypothetical protein